METNTTLIFHFSICFPYYLVFGIIQFVISVFSNIAFLIYISSLGEAK